MAPKEGSSAKGPSLLHTLNGALTPAEGCALTFTETVADAFTQGGSAAME